MTTDRTTRLAPLTFGQFEAGVSAIVAAIERNTAAIRDMQHSQERTEGRDRALAHVQRSLSL